MSDSSTLPDIGAELEKKSQFRKAITTFLNKIRTPDKDAALKSKIINTSLVLVLGIALGVFSKWLDNLSINDAIWWQHILGTVDLRNVFSDLGIWVFAAIAISVFSKTPLRASLNVLLFFVGMTVSYHLYTIYFSGFNLQDYMLIWYGITAITPILAFVCWYAKGQGKISIVLSGLILAVMFTLSFSIGRWYFDFKSTIDTILFVATILVLYVNPKNSSYSLLLAVVLAYALRIFNIC